MFLMAIIVPLLGALIGWLTNKIAIKLIFRPYQPIIIPILNYSLQGLLPKRRSRIAADIGELVERDLLPVEDLLTRFKEPELQKKMTEGLGIAVYLHLVDRFPVSLPEKVRKLIFCQVQEVVRREAPSFFDKLTGAVASDIKKQLSLQELVREKIESFDIKKLEMMLVAIVAKELKHIEILGGILGFLIGIIQVLIINLL